MSTTHYECPRCFHEDGKPICMLANNGIAFEELCKHAQQMQEWQQGCADRTKQIMERLHQEIATLQERAEKAEATLECGHHASLLGEVAEGVEECLLCFNKRRYWQTERERANLYHAHKEAEAEVNRLREALELCRVPMGRIVSAPLTAGCPLELEAKEAYSAMVEALKEDSGEQDNTSTDCGRESLQALSLIQHRSLTPQEEAWAKELIPEVDAVLGKNWLSTVGIGNDTGIARALDAAEKAREEGEEGNEQKTP
jgi:hypothetical protein